MAELKYPLSLVIRATDRVTAPIQAMSKRLEAATSRASAPFRRLGNRLQALSSAAGIPKLVDRFKGVGEAAGALGSKVVGIAKAFVGLPIIGGAALYGIVRGAEAAGSRLEDMASLTGLSVNAFAELEFAAKRSGVENEAFAASMKKFNKSLSEARRGVGPLAGLLSKVGPVYLRQLKAVKSNEEGFDLLAKAMGKIADPGKRAELAAAAFGEAGAGMVNALKDGPQGIEALRVEYRKLVGDQTAFAANSGALGDAFDNLELSMLGLRNTAAGALFPAITKLTTALTDFVVKHRDSIQQWATKAGAAIEKWVDGGGMDRLATTIGNVAEDIGKLVDKLGGLEGVAKLAAVAMGLNLAGSAASLAVSMVGLGKEIVLVTARLGGPAVLSMAGWVKYLWMMRASILSGLVPSLTAGTASVWGFTVALLANPITWVVIALGALGLAAYQVYKNWEPLKEFFTQLWEDPKSAIGLFIAWVDDVFGAWSPLTYVITHWEPIKTFFAGLWDNIVSVFTAAWSKIQPIVDGLMTVSKFTPLGLAFEGTKWAANKLFPGDSAPSLGAAAAAPQAVQAPGAAAIQVDFSNLPRGARVTPAPGNTAPLDLNLGYSMVGP